MKAKLKGDLKELFSQKAIHVRSNMIEYVKHFERDDSYHVACLGQNSYNVCFKGMIHEELDNQFYFQYDLNDTYPKIKENPISIYDI
jgi:hypothetical protein